MDEEKLAKAIVKEQKAAAKAEQEERLAETQKFLKGCGTFVVGLSAALAIFIGVCFGSISDEEYIDPNEQPANVAAKRELKTFPWVKDLYVSAGHMNIGVLPGEKEWGAAMITLGVCSTLERNASDLRWVRFVDINKVAAGQSPRQAEIVKVTCPRVE